MSAVLTIEQRVSDCIRQTIGDALSTEPLDPDTQVFGELGFDSLDIIDCVFHLEGEFGISLDEGELYDNKVLTVGDVVALVERHQPR
jgi:acyl carrier protein